MNVKGNAFLARKSLIGREFGEAAWNEVVAAHAGRDSFFSQPIYALTQIPAEKFLAFNDALMARFYPGKTEKEVLWELGERSVEYALSEGQMRGVFKPGEHERFLRFAPNIWKGYYNDGVVNLLETGPGSTDIQILELPLRHGYFEFVAMAFMKRGMELLGAKVRVEVVKGFSKGDDEVRYRFVR